MNSRKTVTGRAPRPPNLQNIPIRTPEGQAVRDAFLRVLWDITYPEEPDHAERKAPK